MRTLDEIIETMELIGEINWREKEANADVLHYLKQLRERRGWIPVSLRMPGDEEIVAVRCVTKKGTVTWNRAYWDGLCWHGSGSFAGVTHWMPISTEVDDGADAECLRYG